MIESTPRTELTTLTSRVYETARHTTHYLESGPDDGPLMVFLHGWPSISLIWHAQMDAFSADGWHCIAPDLRGYGDSSRPVDVHAYTTREVVTDMIELHDHLGSEPAVWVGHDWGAVVAGAIAAHEPGRCRALVLTSLAYQPAGHGLPTIVPQVDRAIYPADEYPDGQWDYYRFYETHFDQAVADLDADTTASLASIYRKGDPDAVGSRSPSADVTRRGGRFGDTHRAPSTEPDPDLWPKEDFQQLAAAFRKHGFRAPSAWYVNDEANIAYAAEAPRSGHLEQPVLFVNGDFDQICSITGNHQGDAMREACRDLTVVSLPAGHWVPVERKEEHVDRLRAWLQERKL